MEQQCHCRLHHEAVLSIMDAMTAGTLITAICASLVLNIEDQYAHLFSAWLRNLRRRREVEAMYRGIMARQF